MLTSPAGCRLILACHRGPGTTIRRPPSRRIHGQIITSRCPRFPPASTTAFIAKAPAGEATARSFSGCRRTSPSPLRPRTAAHVAGAGQELR